MNPLLSQDYNVDGRYAFGKNAADNTAAKAFLNSYLQRKRIEREPNLEGERGSEDRFIVSGPGGSTYSFRNSFVASK